MPGKPIYRPQIHFSPPSGWMNDPNGLVFHDGLWHLFYQYHPHSLQHGPMHWGHATSKDLIAWEHWPIALCPDALGNIWSGSAVVNDKDDIVAYFTHQNSQRQAQSFATSSNGGHTFIKYAGNPVLTSDRRDFRDPKVFRYGREWRMIVAAGSNAQIYSSTDLVQWKLLSNFPTPERSWIWECPDLFPLGGKWVLIASFLMPDATISRHESCYWIGEFDGETFTPDVIQWQKLSFGPDDYAAVTWNDAPNKRRVLLGWMNRWSYAAQTPTAEEGFRGAMTLPRELSLRGGKLLQNPVPEIEQHRGTAIAWDGTPLELESDCFEIEVTLDLSRTGGEAVFSIGAGDEDTQICLRPGEAGEIRLDRSRSGAVDFSPYFLDKSALAFLETWPPQMDLRIFVDRCSIEVFANGGEFYGAALIFPTATSRSLNFRADGGAQIVSGTLYYVS